MAYTQSGARAFMMAHQMMLRAATENHPAHAEHVREYIEYSNSLADHYYQQSAAYTDKRINESVPKEVDKALGNTRVQLKVDEKSAQSAEKSIRSIFHNLFG